MQRVRSVYLESRTRGLSHIPVIETRRHRRRQWRVGSRQQTYADAACVVPRRQPVECLLLRPANLRCRPKAVIASVRLNNLKRSPESAVAAAVPGRPALHERQRRHCDIRGVVAPGDLELEHQLLGGFSLHALVGQRWPRDVPAPLLRPLALSGLEGRALAEFAPFVRRSVAGWGESAQRAGNHRLHTRKAGTQIHTCRAYTGRCPWLP